MPAVAIGWKKRLKSKPSMPIIEPSSKVATRFISALSGCDGAIVLNGDLSLIGFGAEICSELDKSVSVVERKSEFSQDVKKCDIEQFGMRHRSAIKLASQTSSYRVI